MARRIQDNPQLDMTPMIDVVFELIIFFVVTLTQCNAIRLEDGRHGIELTPEAMPPTQMTVDVARTGRISMGDITLTPEQIGQRVKERKRKFGEFPVLIRADKNARHEAVARVMNACHEAVARVMNACTANGIWKISFMAIHEHKAK